MAENLAAEFLRLPFVPQLALCACAALPFRLIPARQVRIAMSRLRQPAASQRTGLPWFVCRPIPPRALPWLHLIIGGIVTLGSLGAVLWPWSFTTHDSPAASWLCVFIAMSVTFTGFWVFPARERREG